MPSAFLAWCTMQAAARGQRAVVVVVVVLVLIWDKASWHQSQIVRRWLRAHNRPVKQAGHGVRLIACFLPVKSPCLNAIEPQWLAGKKRLAEPDRLLAAAALVARVCATYACPHYPHLVQPAPTTKASHTSKKAA